MPAPAVLIADDEAICLTIASRMLEQVGIRVITAVDGIEALHLFEKFREEIAVILLDIEMPGLNGVETFRRLKQLRGDVRVVIVSGHVTAANRRLLDVLRPAGYVNKPLTVRALAPFLGDVYHPGSASC